MNMKRAIIVGGGIAGPAMGIELKRMQFEVEIFEGRNQEEMIKGVFLGLTPNGINVLRDFIDVSALKDDYTPGTMQFFNARNRFIGRLETKQQLARYGAETIQVKRARLSYLLRQAAESAGVPIRYGKKLVQLMQEPNGVTAEFEDGTSASGDLLLACDGINSVCRRIIFPNAPGPVYTHQLSSAGYARVPGLEDQFGSIRMIFGAQAFFAYAVSNIGEIWWFNNFYSDVPLKEENGKLKDHLLALHATDPDAVREIIRRSENIFAYPIYEYQPLPEWHSGNVCLLGDAAHATAPHIGQGASLALEDVKMLGKTLRDSATLQEAFLRFQESRKPRVEKMIRTARKVGNKKTAPNPIATFMRDLFLPYFIRFEARRTDWIYSYRV